MTNTSFTKILAVLVSAVLIAVSIPFAASAASEGLSFVSNGDGTCYVAGIGSCTDTAIVIPATAPNGDAVVAIADNAFSGEDDIVSVDFGSVTEIGKFAFSGCASLATLDITSVKNIGDGAFEDCIAIEEIALGGDLDVIGIGAFYGCTGLTEVVIPESVTAVKNFAFSDCTALAGVTVGGSVSSIGSFAFSGCGELVEINYNGDHNDWSAISKGALWNDGTGEYTVNCTDGTYGTDGVFVPSADTQLGDLNGDTIIDLLDLSEFAVALANSELPEASVADMNGDGIVDLLDYSDLAVSLAG